MIEVLIALAILTLVMLTSMAVFFERQKRLRDADDLFVAYQALANESEVLRHVPYATLVDGTTVPFQSDTALLSSLDAAVATEAIKQESPGLKSVTLVITWRGGEKRASMQIIRADTGGGPLW